MESLITVLFIAISFAFINADNAKQKEDCYDTQAPIQKEQKALQEKHYASHVYKSYWSEDVDDMREPLRPDTTGNN